MTRPARFAALTLAFAAAPAGAADWLFAPSTYTHDPQTGQRVAQYAPIPPVTVAARPDYLKSGYRHNRSSIFSGDGADHHHVVEQWGRPVRPYGEWLYPYRSYSVPYQFWGPPYAGLGYPIPPPYWPRRGVVPPHNPQDPADQGPGWPGEFDPPGEHREDPRDWGGASGPT